MTLAQMESRFFELKGRLSLGLMTEDEFKREMEKLRFQDQQGRWWMMGAQSGKWYYYEGSRWLIGQPPEIPAADLAPEAPRPESPVPLAPAQAAAPTGIGATKPDSAPPRPSMPPVASTLPPPPVTGSSAARPRTPSAANAPNWAARVRGELPHVHMSGAKAPAVPLPHVRAPAPLRRYPPALILAGTVLVGVLLVALLALAVDNLAPGSPISSFLGRSVISGTPTPLARDTMTADAVNVDNLVRVGDELVAKSQFSQAFAQFQNAARSAPNSADVQAHYARALALTGRIQDAVSAAQKAAQLDPSSSDAYAELARALAWSGQGDAAVAAGQKAVDLDPKSASANAMLAEALLRAGKSGDAQKEAEIALALDDQNPDAHRAAGWVAVVQRNQDQAISEWNKVTELAPDLFFYHYELGLVYAIYGNDPASAVPEYQKAIQLFPPYVPSYLALGRAYLAQNQPGPAVPLFQKALTFDGNSLDAYVGLGQAYEMQKQCGQAIPYYQRSLGLDKTSNDALRGLADCGALASGQPTPAPTSGVGSTLLAVPTAIVQATAAPLAGNQTAGKATAVATSVAKPAGLAGRLAFSVYDGQYHLFTANLDGTNRTLVTELASDPQFSPDGSQLLYASWQSDQRGINRIEVNGSGDEQVSLHMEDLLPSWSPGGTRYVYSTRAGQGSDVSKRPFHLRISDPTAGADQDPPDLVIGQYPAWGPKDVVVYRDCGFPTDACGLSVIRPDGSGYKSIVPATVNSTAPSWSPDGAKIAFMSDYSGSWDIYIVNSDGSSLSRLTTDGGQNGLPAFSPDGKQIAYFCQKGGIWSICAMGIDGSNQHKLFDLGGDPAGTVPGNPSGQPGQVWTDQRLSWH